MTSFFECSERTDSNSTVHAYHLQLRVLSHAVALALAGFSAVGLAAQDSRSEEEIPRAKDDTVRLGTITVVGQGDRLGAGQMLQEEAVKARSTVTRDATDKDRATSNVYQSISLLPGVNTFNYDATGLFGGGLTIRGFGADQIGFTINGVPVNDSGNFAIYPQEYADSENICLQSVAQGNPDIETPHIGASGGSVSMVSCDPLAASRLRVSQTLGELRLSRTFLRADSGRFAQGRAKAFISYSYTEANKWKGPGKAKRDHIDAAFSLDLSRDNRILGSVLYNKAINNNILTPSLAQLNANGYFYDFSPSFTPGKLPAVNGTAQRETGPTPAYYKLSTNPFENAIVSLSGSFKLAEQTYLKVQPYWWYGFGTGGTQQRALSETAFLNTSTGRIGAGVDLNGDRDTLDTIVVSSSSVTKTSRPGLTAEINHQMGNHALKFGFWYERADHRQTGPAVPVKADGSPVDVWLRNERIRRPDGSFYQFRDWHTISPAWQFYASDSISFMNDRGLLQLGVRTPRITRKFTNFASEGTNSQIPYTFEKSYDDVLPQLGLRFNLDREQQVFANIGKNFRAPPNFAFAPTGNNVQIVGAVPTLVGKIEAETSITTDLGYRYQSRALSFSGNVFQVDFRNRQGNAFDPNILRSIYTNLGKVRIQGLEAELGTTPVSGWSAYLSLTAQKSKVLNDVRVNATTVLPSQGKQLALTPELMAGVAVQYASGPFYARLKVKHTGRQYATLMNDESVPAYTLADFDAGYRLGDLAFAKGVMARLNVSNIGDRKYRSPSSGFILNAKPYGTAAAQTVFYYLGAPRLVTVTLSADF